MKAELIQCACYQAEHSIIAHHDDKENMVYLEVHLNKHSFFKRLWYAVKYIFGYQCRYGAFEEIIITSEQKEKFENIVKTITE